MQLASGVTRYIFTVFLKTFLLEHANWDNHIKKIIRGGGGGGGVYGRINIQKFLGPN